MYSYSEFRKSEPNFRLSISYGNAGVDEISKFIANAAKTQTIESSRKPPLATDFSPGKALIAFGDQYVVFHFIYLQNEQDASSVEKSYNCGSLGRVEYLRVPESFVEELRTAIEGQNNPSIRLSNFPRPQVQFITLEPPAGNHPELSLSELADKLAKSLSDQDSPGLKLSELRALCAVRSVSEWNDTYDRICSSRQGNAPDNWYELVLNSGLAAKILRQFPQ